MRLFSLKKKQKTKEQKKSITHKKNKKLKTKAKKNYVYYCIPSLGTFVQLLIHFNIIPCGQYTSNTRAIKFIGIVNDVLKTSPCLIFFKCATNK